MAEEDEPSAADEVLGYFSKICDSNSAEEVQELFKSLSSEIGVDFDRHGLFYPALKEKLSTSWKFTELSTLYDKRVIASEYAQQTPCSGMRCLVIGAGPVGLRTAIEAVLLGAKVDVVEKRKGYSRNNVLHLWPFLITDLRNLGAKRFYGKFCSGDLDHISIRMLELVLLKAALFLGIKVHTGVEFKQVVEPKGARGWRADVSPHDCPVSGYDYDIMVGADGKKYVLPGFRTKEFRPKLAIAITANFVNHYTQDEARVPEISGIAYIYHQEFFNNLRDRLGIELENLVYYKDETHYFVMTTKKQSLLAKKVLKQDFDDAALLLNSSNISQKCLQDYAREVAVYATKGGLALDTLEFKLDVRGKEDVALFDFTSLFAAENAARIVERQGKRVLMCIVGDSLIEPFWPTGSGLGRGFLGALDAAWMMKGFGEGKPAMDLIEEREATLQLLSQTKPERLNKSFQSYTINPASRYLDMRGVIPMGDLSHLHDTGQGPQRPTEIIRSGLASKNTDSDKGLSRNRRYKTIGGTSSSRSRDGDSSEKIDLDFLKKWGRPGNDPPSDKAITRPAVSASRESKGKHDAKKPEQGSDQRVPAAPAVGTNPEPVEADRQTGVTKVASLFGSTAKGPALSPARKTSEKNTSPAKPPTLPKPVEKIAQMRKAALSDTSDVKTATSAATGAVTEEAPSQPPVIKKRHSLFSLLRPSSPKKGEKTPSSPKKGEKTPSSPKKGEKTTSSLQKGEKTAKRPGSAKEKRPGSASPQKKASKLQVSKQGKSSPQHKPAVQKAAEGSRQTPTSTSESKVHRQQHEEKSPSEGVTRSQSMVNVSINSVVNFYEQRISQLQPSAGADVTAKKTPSSSNSPRKQQTHAARRHGHRGKEEVDSGLCSRAYHSMMDLSKAAIDTPTQPMVEPNEAPPNAPPTPSPPPPTGDIIRPPAQQEPMPAALRRRMTTGQRPITWALDDIAESKGEVKPSLQAGGGDSSTDGSGRWSAVESGKGAPPPSEPLWLVRYIASLNQSMEVMRRDSDIIEAKTALEIMHTITSNIEVHPDEDRYRRVRVSSSKFNEQVWKLDCCRSFMLKSGWLEIDDFIVAPIGKSLAVPLRVVSKHLSIVNNMIWSQQVVIPDTGKAHPSRTRHGSLMRKESYATKVVNDAMDRVAMAALRVRRTPSPRPILEEEDESDNHHLPKESKVPQQRVEEIQTMRAAHSARRQWLNRLSEATFTRPEVEWKPSLEAELYGDKVTAHVPWKRKLSDPASEMEDLLGQARVAGAHVFSDTPVLFSSHGSTMPTAVTDCGLWNISRTVPSPTTVTAPPTTVTALPTSVTASSTTVAAPPTYVGAPPTAITSMEDAEAISLLASDRSIKAVSVESLRSISDEEEGEGDRCKVEVVTKEGLQAFQLHEGADDTVRAVGKRGTQLSVASVRELWLKRSTSMDDASSLAKMAAVPPPSVRQSATSTSLAAEAVQEETVESDTLSSHPRALPLQKSQTMPDFTAVAVRVHSNSESSESSNSSKREEEKMVLEAGKAAHALARSVFTQNGN